MAEYDDPLAALPTVAPPRVKKPQVEDPLAPVAGGGGQIFDGPTFEKTTDEFLGGDDYFGSFPTDPVDGPMMDNRMAGDSDFEIGGGPLPSPEEFKVGGGGMEWEGDLVNSMAPTTPPLADDLFDTSYLRRMGKLGDVGYPADPTAAPVPGGETGRQENDIIPPGMQPDAPTGPLSDEELLEQYRRFASEGLDNPSRYDIDTVRQGMEQMDLELADQREQGISTIDEMMAQRGLVGSSVEGNQRSELISDLDRNRSDYGFKLLQDMARTQGADRTAAANVASEGLRIRIAQRANELQEEGMDLDEAFRQAKFEEEKKQFYGEDEFPGTFSESQRRFDASQDIQWAQLFDELGLSDEQVERFMESIGGEQGEALRDKPDSFDTWKKKHADSDGNWLKDHVDYAKYKESFYD